MKKDLTPSVSINLFLAMLLWHSSGTKITRLSLPLDHKILRLGSAPGVTDSNGTWGHAGHVMSETARVWALDVSCLGGNQTLGSLRT